jgi:hypothetical protein
MVIRIRLVPLTLLTLVFVLLCSLNSDAQTPQFVESTKPVLDWLVDNWAAVALIVSETAALISLKYSGIIKSVLAFLTTVIKKK